MFKLFAVLYWVLAAVCIAGTGFLWASLIYAAWNAPCSDAVWNALALVCAFK